MVFKIRTITHGMFDSVSMANVLLWSENGKQSSYITLHIIYRQKRVEYWTIQNKPLVITLIVQDLIVIIITNISDIVDSSGIRMTLSPHLRQHDSGGLSVGVSVRDTQFIPPYQKAFLSTGYCDGRCTSGVCI